MSLMNGKKKVTQDDLRRAMTEHKKRMGTVKKIESPLAKYTDSGQLMCILCKLVVRSETVWSIHLNSKIHKENIATTKKARIELENFPKPVAPVLKRSSSPSSAHSTNKKMKGILKNSNEPQSQLPVDFFDKAQKQTDALSRTGLPGGNQDKKNEILKESEESDDIDMKEGGKEINQAQLPEGFFDDPVMDAKVRNVEYKDPIEEEWEKFQKEIKEEAAQSAQIIADDQEEATTERQLDEIEEQMRHWSRVLKLERRKEQVQAVEKKRASVDEDISSGDEVEFDEFLDWRAKKSYK